MTDLLELTIARLRYYLGGDRPSQTPHHLLSFIGNTDEVRIHKTKSGLSLTEN